MNTVSVRIEGISPLLMHSAQGVDDTHPYRRESKELTSKGSKKRTDQDASRLLQLDFMLSLYHNGKVPVIPETVILGTIRAGAARSRRGKEVLAGVMVEPQEPELIYDGPKEVNALFESLEHRDVRPVGVQRQRVIRCRPRFNKWALEFNLIYDPGVINEKSLRDALEAGGQYCGIGDFRPRFGRFEVTSWRS